MATRPDPSPDDLAPRVAPVEPPPDGPAEEPVGEPSEALPDQLDPDDPDHALPNPPPTPD